ncbi:DUF6493 family protein [Streptomyces coeruleoprunus]|uniref:DUF6493 family protein n=1 Tax=Streptomyces coeruleoprunus TaxID=285563 RepID=A0ABV9XK48_9ACTN
MKELLDVVRQGRVKDVPELVRSLDRAGRKEALAELKELRGDVRGWGWGEWEKRRLVQRALLLAGGACQSGAAAAASWIAARDLRGWEEVPYTTLVGLLSDRDSKWLADVAHRLAARTATARTDYPLIRELVRLSGCEVPLSDGYVYGWVDAVTRSRGRSGLRELRTDPHTPLLVPRLFETSEVADALSWSEQWGPALVSLSQEGVVDRRVLVDGCVARLLRGGKSADLRFFLGLLRLLELTPQEERERTADWMGLAADAPSPVAGYAQEVLARLVLAGGLPARQLAEVSSSVLFRPEKKLVRAQLVLLGKALRQEPGAAGELLPVLSDVFGHEDTALQERALKLVGRHLASVDEESRGELAGAAALLSPVHRDLADEVFGPLLVTDDLASGPYEEILPPLPEPQRLAPPPETLAELVEEVAALLHGRDAGTDVVAREHALDGLVRFAHQDREALAEALAPCVADLWWHDDRTPDLTDLSDVALVVATLLGNVSPGRLQGAVRRQMEFPCRHGRLERIATVRAQEAALGVLTGPLPFLLATPTWHTGTVDPGELVGRLAEYRRLDLRPAECDFAQALLRVRRTGPGAAEAAGAAARLGTEEGDRLAAWLTGEESYGPGVRTVCEVPPPSWSIEPPMKRIAMATPERLVLQREFPAVFQPLGRPWDPGQRACYHWEDATAAWMAVLPEDREVLAAWLLPLAAACADDEQRGGTGFLTALAEAGGEAGPAVHLALAHGLGARHTEDRLVAVDALLVLAARGDLDAQRLGVDLAELVGIGTVKVNRAADALRTAAGTGAYSTVWRVLAGALPGLLADGEPPRGTGEILALAAECAERSGAAGATGTAAVPGLEALGSRRGSSQLVVQARRLANALRQSAEQTTTQMA